MSDETVINSVKTAVALAEELTGVKVEDTERFVQQMEIDQIALIDEYNLPSFATRFQNPQQYLEQLQEKTKEIGVAVKIGEFPAYDEEARIIYLPNPTSFEDEDLKRYIHELVHALDFEHHQGMSLEQMEYRAYLSDLGDVRAVANALGEDFVGFFFGSVGASVKRGT